MSPLGSPPDIKSYSWQKRRDYLLLLASVAASDSVLEPEEIALLERWVVDFGLSPKASLAVMEAAKRKQVDPQTVIKLERHLAKTDLAFSLLLDMLSMAMADGVLMDDERDILVEVADALGITTVEFNILVDFVHAANQAAALANPEPLYEHSIEAAFTLLLNKGITLFPHTILCQSPEYNLKLKERWYRRQAC